MAKTFETAFRIGAKFTGQHAFAQTNAALDRTQRNAKQLNSTLGRLSAGFAGIGKVAAGAFAGLVAFNVVGRAVRGIKDLSVAAFGAADNVAKVREEGRLLIQSFGVTAKEAAIVEKRLYGISEAMEKSAQKGHDAEVMVKVLEGVRKVMPTEMVEKNQRVMSDYLTAIGGVAPTTEQAEEAAASFNQAVLRGRGALLMQLNFDKQRMKNFGKLLPMQRRAILLEEMQKKFGGLTTRAMISDSGKMAYAMTQFGNILENLGAGAVESKGQIGDMLTTIAFRLQKLASQISPYLHKRIVELLAFIEAKFPVWEDLLWRIGRAYNFVMDSLGRLGNVMIVVNAALKVHNTLFENFWKLFNVDRKPLDEIWINILNGLESVKKGLNEFVTLWTDQWERIVKIIEKAIQRILKLFDLLPFQKIRDLWMTAPQLPFGAGVPRSMEPYTGVTPSGTGAAKPSTGYAPYQRERGGGAVGAVGMISPTLAQERARLIAELDANPALREKLLRVAQAEVGTSNPQRTAAFMESLFNRAATRKQTLDRALQADYYETLRGGPLANPTPAQAAAHEAAIKGVAAGSNVSSYATGNFAHRGGGLGGRGGYPSAYIGGEQFSVQAADAAAIARIKATDAAAATKMKNEPADPQHPIGKNPWGVQLSGQNVPAPPPPPKPLNYPKAPLVPMGSSLKDTIKEINMKQRMSATGPTNVAMNPVINVHGVEAGKERVVANAVKNALQDPIRNLLDQLKAAQASENRLSYV